MSGTKDTLKGMGLGNVAGAFADGAILFPLMAALVLQTGMDGALILAVTGTAYIAAGLVFRVPMAVQPLKSVVIAALAVGATAQEIAWAGFAVGFTCLFLSFCNANRVAALVPRHIVHGLQAALGVLLISKGLSGGIWADFSSLSLFVLLAGAIIWMSVLTDKPVLGWVAAAGLCAGLILTLNHDILPVQAAHKEVMVDFGIVMALVLPQLALTLANSVVGTHDVAHRYFGNAAGRVTPSRLLLSIGIGNMLAAPIGSMPFCHGAGGLTAHVKGGAKTWHMNLIMGTSLLTLAGISALLAVPLLPAYPQALLSALLVATGWFHLHLAVPSWREAGLRAVLAAMVLAALIGQGMLWALGAGIVVELARRAVNTLRMRTQ